MFCYGMFMYRFMYIIWFNFHQNLKTKKYCMYVIYVFMNNNKKYC